MRRPSGRSRSASRHWASASSASRSIVRHHTGGAALDERLFTKPRERRASLVGAQHLDEQRFGRDPGNGADVERISQRPDGERVEQQSE